MKRSPLKRTTPLRSRTPLRSTTTLKSTKPINPVSKKRAAENRQRAKVKKQIMDTVTACQAGPLIAQADRRHRCWREPHDIHEPLTRARGGSITDPENMIVVCRSCHDWIHNNPSAAQTIGLLVSGYGRRQEPEC